MPHIWVVEAKIKDEWRPCADCRLAKRLAKKLLAYWRMTGIGDDYRVAKYVREAT